MYLVQKAVIYGCSSCQNVRHFGSDVLLRATLYTLGKPSVNVQRVVNTGITSRRRVCSIRTEARPLSACCSGVLTRHAVKHSDAKNRHLQDHKCLHNAGHHNKHNHNDPFIPEKILILPKVTRLAFEKRRNPDLDDPHLRDKLAKRGSDYENLVERNSVHLRDLENLVNKLEQSKADVRVCQQMSDYTEDNVDWADLIISAGGDGTFLSASRKVFGNKPIIGVNTDVDGSEGFLCLPRVYSSDITRALDLMKAGSYRWRKRARIRVTVKGGDTIQPIDLYDEDLTFADHCYLHNSERLKNLERQQNGENNINHIIPIRGLNEVFVGESLSSRMSYYEISIDDGPLEKQKSSGITICTGTGSTSWSFNINKMSYQSVEEVLKIANHLTGSNYPTNRESVKTVADSFNSRLLFDPRVLQMVYTVRDPVVYGIFQVHKPRGFARKITIRSRCRDACLTVDAGTSYLFNDGAIATLEMHDEDALRTMEMIDTL